MPKRVTPEEAHRLMQDGYLYVDVRSVGEFDRGHPEGALNVPLLDMNPALGGMVPNPQFLPAMKAMFARDTKLIIGCQMGGRSARAVHMLEEAGFEDVVDVPAGFDGSKDALGRLTEPGWARVGLPVETQAPPDRCWSAIDARRMKNGAS